MSSTSLPDYAKTSRQLVSLSQTDQAALITELADMPDERGDAAVSWIAALPPQALGRLVEAGRTAQHQEAVLKFSKEFTAQSRTNSEALVLLTALLAPMTVEGGRRLRDWVRSRRQHDEGGGG